MIVANNLESGNRGPKNLESGIWLPLIHPPPPHSIGPTILAVSKYTAIARTLKRSIIIQARIAVDIGLYHGRMEEFGWLKSSLTF